MYSTHDMCINRIIITTRILCDHGVKKSEPGISMLQSTLPYVVDHVTWFVSKRLILQHSCHESEEGAPCQSIISFLLFSTHKFWNNHFEIWNINISLRQINTVGKISKVNSRCLFQLVIFRWIDWLIDWLIRKQLQEQKRNGSPLRKSPPAWPFSPLKLVKFYTR